MKRVLSDPRAYVAWLVLLVGVLLAAYATDPYVFGFAVFGLGAATGAVCAAGVYFVILNPGASRSGRQTVWASLLLAVAAILGSLAMLGTFRWA